MPTSPGAGDATPNTDTVPAVTGQEPDHHLQQGALARRRRADHRRDGALGYVQVDPVERRAGEGGPAL